MLKEGDRGGHGLTKGRSSILEEEEEEEEEEEGEEEEKKNIYLLPQGSDVALNDDSF